MQGAVEENLPTSIPSVEPNVHDQTEEEKDKNDPKEKDEDKSNGEDDETQYTEKRGVCSETSELKIAHDSISTQENVMCTYCEKVVPSRPDHNCDTCDQVFNNKKGLKKHRKKKHTTRGNACKICETTFRKSKTLRLYIRQDHENESDDEGYAKDITGGDKSNDEGSVNKDKTIEGDSNQQHEKESEVFNSKKRLKKHMIKKHTTGGKYACEICERTFRKSKILRLHICQDHEN